MESIDDLDVYVDTKRVARRKKTFQTAEAASQRELRLENRGDRKT